jgi:hypothetical protein
MSAQLTGMHPPPSGIDMASAFGAEPSNTDPVSRESQSGAATSASGCAGDPSPPVIPPPLSDPASSDPTMWRSLTPLIDSHERRRHAQVEAVTRPRSRRHAFVGSLRREDIEWPRVLPGCPPSGKCASRAHFEVLHGPVRRSRNYGSMRWVHVHSFIVPPTLVI